MNLVPNLDRFSRAFEAIGSHKPYKIWYDGRGFDDVEDAVDWLVSWKPGKAEGDTLCDCGKVATHYDDYEEQNYCQSCLEEHYADMVVRKVGEL